MRINRTTDPLVFKKKRLVRGQSKVYKPNLKYVRQKSRMCFHPDFISIILPSPGQIMNSTLTPLSLFLNLSVSLSRSPYDVLEWEFRCLSRFALFKLKSMNVAYHRNWIEDDICGQIFFLSLFYVFRSHGQNLKHFDGGATETRSHYGLDD